MGCRTSKNAIVGRRGKKNYTIFVKTGDHQGAGTNANVYVVLVNKKGTRSHNINLDCIWRDDFECGSTDTFPVSGLSNFGDITDIELWRTGYIYDAWYIEWIEVHNNKNNKQYIFPIDRWMTSEKRMRFQEYDCVLPQFSKFPQQRKKELKKKKREYAFAPAIEGLPCQVTKLPRGENLSTDYNWEFMNILFKNVTSGKIIELTTSGWESIDDLGNVYESNTFPVPLGMYHWRSDVEFGKQRLTGCNPGIIRLCTEIPENFAVTNEMLQPLLEEMTIDDAIEKKRLFIVDLKLMKNIKCTVETNTVCSPIALFFVNKDLTLLPVAIQLFQDTSDDNPVFLPTDNEYTWMIAKMWFNNADASYHQSATHLGMTHLIVESIAAATHCCLSPSHPLFRLLAPHFLYVIIINKNEKLGIRPKLALVCEKVQKYEYTSNKILEDNELQEWHKILSSPVSEGGCGIQGIPGDGSFKTAEEIIQTVTSTIFTCSVSHAAVNFGQYENYGFPPHYPAFLNGQPPTNKEPKREADVLKYLPSKSSTLTVMEVTKLLSVKGTNGLGNFEVSYQFDPVGKKAVEQFKEDLVTVAATIDQRNNERESEYNYLHPKHVPNAISI
ncbi:allene oxide synthase-lipoxygenase protein-like [Anneissia japonica]|uniref:allene oxide synthase-lipoxygenase protein-like n=1 Tax=Anneissia japonica TaxID=1529436 RepID=UPI00142573FC|nr:allene oxide synthase-lipoxygenase protein-like [Anneissia japonica]